MPNHPTSLMKSVHEDINASHTKRNTCQNVAALFAIDFFTISNKKKMRLVVRSISIMIV